MLRELPDTGESRLVEPALVVVGLAVPAVFALLAVAGDAVASNDLARMLLMLLLFGAPIVGSGAALAALVRAGLLIRRDARRRSAKLLLGWLAVAAVWFWLWTRVVSAF